MIAPLRQRHRRTTAALAVVVPALAVAALVARPAAPPVVELETLGFAAGSVSPPAGGRVLAEHEDLFAEHPVTLRLRAGRVLELVPRVPLARPDVLAYWSAAGAAAGGPLPAGAVLLGALGDGGSAFLELPEAAAGGNLVLYSLGHQQVVAAAALPETAR